MSGPMIAHMLKQAGRGSEAVGLVAVFSAGKLAGTVQTLLGVASFCALRRLAGWALERRADGLRERRYLPDAGMAD